MIGVTVGMQLEFTSYSKQPGFGILSHVMNVNFA